MRARVIASVFGLIVVIFSFGLSLFGNAVLHVERSENPLLFWFVSFPDLVSQAYSEIFDPAAALVADPGNTVIASYNIDAANRFQEKSSVVYECEIDCDYLMLSRYDGDVKTSVIEVVAAPSFELSRRIVPDIESLQSKIDDPKNIYDRYFRDHVGTRHRIFHPLPLESGGIVIHSDGGPLMHLNECGAVSWMNQDYNFHHSTETDHQGNIWVPVEIPEFDLTDLYGGGQTPSLKNDGIALIDASNGKTLFVKSVLRILADAGLHKPILGGMSYQPDPIHLNDIQPVLFDGEHWLAGDIFMSLRAPSLILHYRPSIDKIIKVFRGEWSGQHDVDYDANRGTLTFFNNNIVVSEKGTVVDGTNEILEIDYASGKVTGLHNDLMREFDVRTIGEGLADIGESGSIMVEETNYGRILYKHRGSGVVAEYLNKASDGRVYFLNWSRLLAPHQAKGVSKPCE